MSTEKEQKEILSYLAKRYDILSRLAKQACGSMPKSPTIFSDPNETPKALYPPDVCRKASDAAIAAGNEYLKALDSKKAGKKYAEEEPEFGTEPKYNK